MPRGIPNKTRTEVVDLFGADTDIDTGDSFADDTATQEQLTAEAPLTADQQRIKELEDLLARERGHKDPAREIERPAPDGAGSIVVHILQNGFTANGQVWYRGQELEFNQNSRSYQDTKDRNGRTWLALRDDDFAQIERYGDVMFRSGPWPGKSLLDVDKVEFEPMRRVDNDAPVGRPSIEELTRADEEERRRARGIPRTVMR